MVEVVVEERVDVGFESVRRINRFKDDLDPKS